MRNIQENGIASGYYDGTGVKVGLGLIADRKTVTLVIVWWLEADQRLASDGQMW